MPSDPLAVHNRSKGTPPHTELGLTRYPFESRNANASVLASFLRVDHFHGNSSKGLWLTPVMPCIRHSVPYLAQDGLPSLLEI